MRKLIYALAVVLCASAMWAQGLIICRSCGREAREGETACARCDTALPVPRQEAPPAAAPAVDVSAEVVKLAAAAVEGNYRLAREAEVAPAVALCYYQNAIAIMRLVPPGHFPREVSEALLNGRGRMFNAAMTGRVKCKICDGSGKFQMDTRKTDPAGTVRALTGVPCPACKGKGGALGMAEVPLAKTTLLQGRGEFERSQMLAGEVRLGHAFVPSAMAGMLQIPQRALVMTGMQVPCDSCRGTARQVCTACRGSRWVKCPNTGCRNGTVDVPAPDRRRGEVATRRLNEEDAARCPRCAGIGEIACAPCESHGSVPCVQCAGSGAAPRCTRCTATGLQECQRCKGTGKIRDATCVDCSGGGIVLCTTCRGEGARTR